LFKSVTFRLSARVTRPATLSEARFGFQDEACGRADRMGGERLKIHDVVLEGIDLALYAALLYW
jgi:hypothetical protein